MSKRPSFQFYPSDWKSNANLRRCSFHERGVWIDILCLLHDSEEYGLLRWTLEDISTAINCSISDLKSLIKKGVLKGSDTKKDKVSFSISLSQKNSTPITILLIDCEPGPIWYSSRMIRDEHIRKKRAACGVLALQHENVPKKKAEKCTIDKDTFSPSPSSSSSSSSNNRESIDIKLKRKSALSSFESDKENKRFASSIGVDFETEINSFKKKFKGDTDDLQFEFKNWLTHAKNFKDRKNMNCFNRIDVKSTVKDWGPGHEDYERMHAVKKTS